MTKEEKKYFSRRITQGNKSEIIVVLFDIYNCHEKDAIKAADERDVELLVESIRKMSEVIEHLKADLNFDYEIAGNLYALYDYAARSLAKAIYSLDKSYIKKAANVMNGLREAFAEVAKNDTSSSGMQNSQKVTAGITYGRNDVTEMVESDSNRGFLA